MSNLKAILKGRRSQPHQLIEVLQDVQELCGYIPQDAMIFVSKELGVTLMEVFRVANFYKAFSLAPRGKNVITVCTGTACHVRGANLLIDQIRGQFALHHLLFTPVALRQSPQAAGPGHASFRRDLRVPA